MSVAELKRRLATASPPRRRDCSGRSSVRLATPTCGGSLLWRKSSSSGQSSPATSGGGGRSGSFSSMAGANRDCSVALDRFQQEVLAAFFARQEGFFLTGGGALAGYYLDHRSTHDLDLFTVGSSLDEAETNLAAVARELGANLEAVQTSPDFRRRLLRRESESVIVDLVLDRATQIDPDKRRFGRVAVDSPEEIRANKLCTLLSRSELRDLADLRALEAAGYAVDATCAPRCSQQGQQPDARPTGMGTQRLPNRIRRARHRGGHAVGALRRPG